MGYRSAELKHFDSQIDSVSSINNSLKFAKSQLVVHKYADQLGIEVRQNFWGLTKVTSTVEIVFLFSSLLFSFETFKKSSTLTVYR